MRPNRLIIAFLVYALANVGIALAENVELDEFEVLVEINATDEDAGFQGKIDGEAWTKMRVGNEEGQTIMKVKANKNLKSQGLTEYVWESNEPTFDTPGFSLEEFLDRFPEGEYHAWGKTLEGDWIVGETELTHNLPAGPVITSGDVYTPGMDYLLTWDEVTDDYQGGSLDSDIVRYEVVAEYEGVTFGDDDDDDDEVKRVLHLDVSPDTFSAAIPGDFLPDPDDYDELEVKFEVGAEEESGNRTFTEMEVQAE